MTWRSGGHKAAGTGSRAGSQGSKQRKGAGAAMRAAAARGRRARHGGRQGDSTVGGSREGVAGREAAGERRRGPSRINGESQPDSHAQRRPGGGGWGHQHAARRRGSGAVPPLGRTKIKWAKGDCAGDVAAGSFGKGEEKVRGGSSGCAGAPRRRLLKRSPGSGIRCSGCGQRSPPAARLLVGWLVGGGAAGRPAGGAHPRGAALFKAVALCGRAVSRLECSAGLHAQLELAGSAGWMLAIAAQWREAM